MVRAPFTNAPSEASTTGSLTTTMRRRGLTDIDTYNLTRSLVPPLVDELGRTQVLIIRGPGATAGYSRHERHRRRKYIRQTNHLNRDIEFRQIDLDGMYFCFESGA